MLLMMMAPTAGYRDWRKTKNGNYLLAGDDGVQATVFEKDGEWGGIWNGAGEKARLLIADMSFIGFLSSTMVSTTSCCELSTTWSNRAVRH